MSTLEVRDAPSGSVTCPYDTAHLSYFWDSIGGVGNIAVVSGISGFLNNCIRIIQGGGDVYLVKNLVSDTAKAFHFRFLLGNLPFAGYTPILVLLNNGTVQLQVCVSSSGSVSFWRGTRSSKLCESSSGLVAANVAYVIAGGALFSSVAGNVNLTVNGTAACSASGVATTTDGSSVCNQISCVVIGNVVSTWGPAAYAISPLYFQDIIVDTGTTTVRAPQRNYWVPAAGVGRYSEMSAVGAGSGWQCVTDTSPEPDDDTTYVAAGSAGLRNAYAIAAPTVTNVDYGLHRIIVAKTDDGGAATVTPGFSNGTTDASGTAIAVPSSYQALRQSFDNNPITGTGPTVADLSTLQLLDTRSS